ncbi:NAD(P)/FAD-dependent oxidoreductase [Agreia sp. COWG]|uniref:flavin-containing monooxygenase n=1 Tax=Agreia sp. COWG TaxID=2773266 RepID=UPI001AFB4141|nr:NAD(P)/FAD-dependent oxidoreductase [Agreia sp. COWG]CAD6003296.1 Predicted flavoprotein CzcO associated with the cation diffusion facilitator CzcD [Agreia sp. COWG]
MTLERTQLHGNLGAAGARSALSALSAPESGSAASTPPAEPTRVVLVAPAVAAVPVAPTVPVGEDDGDAAHFSFLGPMLERRASVQTLAVTQLAGAPSGSVLIAMGEQAAPVLRFVRENASAQLRVVVIDPHRSDADSLLCLGVTALALSSGGALGDVREELRVRPARILSVIEEFIDGAAPGHAGPEATSREGAARGIRHDAQPRTALQAAGQTDAGVTVVDTVIVGAGFAGLGMGIRLARQGDESFVILERAADVGGTWRDNTYPGVACDIPSHLYSFSFAPKPDWSSFFAPGAEIHDYLRDTARAEGLEPHLRLGTEVLEMRWLAEEARWRVSTSGGTFSCRTLVVAAGRLSDAKLPAVPGLESFAGDIMHSSTWDDSVDLAGKRVGVVGTGASAAQLIPHIERLAGSVVVFQRSAPWVVPRPDRPYSAEERALFAAAPPVREAERDELFWGAETAFAERMRVPGYIDRLRDRALGHLRAQLDDAALREAATPDYEIGCKRVVISSDYYPALASETVTLEASALASITTTGTGPALSSTVRAASGNEYDVDVLVFATGFSSTRPPFAERTVGIGGVLLADAWSDGMRSHASTAVHGFPNMFVLDGPNASLGHNSAVVMIEAQIGYVLAAMRQRVASGIPALDVTRQAQDAYVAELDAKAASSVWLTGGCDSWYVDERSGRLTLLWPDFAYAFRRRLSRFDPENYAVLPVFGD